MTRAAFVVSKHPFVGSDGETVVTRLLLQAAARCCEVTVVALAEGPGPREGFELVEVPKPRVRMGKLLAASAYRRRSLMHLRFSPPELVDALRSVDADTIVARRAYMAQAPLDAGRVPPSDRLVVLVDVLESTVMRRRHGPLRPAYLAEARRTRRDEIRCVRAASDLAFFSDTEIDELSAAVPGGNRRLDLILPPAPSPAPLSEPLALFVGDRRWPPNADALARVFRLWPRILGAVPRARLLVIGHPAARERVPEDPGVECLGFVDDLEAVWRSAGVLLAPVAIGGGVRVKVLDAARHGVPVVGSPAAIASTQHYLPISPQRSDDEFVAEASLLLGGIDERRRRGVDLYEANRELHAQGFVEEQLTDILLGPPTQRAVAVSPEPAGKGA